LIFDHATITDLCCKAEFIIRRIKERDEVKGYKKLAEADRKRNRVNLSEANAKMKLWKSNLCSLRQQDGLGLAEG
jgi:hypothetical protein